MDGYKHYVRINETGIIIHGFSDAFEQPQEGDILILENGPRHFHQVWPEQLTTERGQYRFKWVDGQKVERSVEELDTEWAVRPPGPETPEQKMVRLEVENAELKQQLSQFNNDFVAFTEFYFSQNPDQA